MSRIGDLEIAAPRPTPPEPALKGRESHMAFVGRDFRTAG
jgi:hypothetical protein